MVKENNNFGFETCQDFKITDGIQYTLNIRTCNSFAGTVMKSKKKEIALNLYFRFVHYICLLF
jgi:hypothetical protein